MTSAVRLLHRYNLSIQDYLDLLADLRIGAAVVHPTGEPPPCRDEKDRKYRHCAVAARVDYLITRDRDLLDMGQIEGVPIVTPAAFLARAQEAGVVLDARGPHPTAARRPDTGAHEKGRLVGAPLVGDGAG